MSGEGSEEMEVVVEEARMGMHSRARSWKGGPSNGVMEIISGDGNELGGGKV